MMKFTLKETIKSRKFSILIIVVQFIVIWILLGRNLDNQSARIWNQSVPDINLTNSLTETSYGFQGEVRGFVKFDNFLDQPKDFRQYYVIKPMNVSGQDDDQKFTLEEFIKLNALSTRSLGTKVLGVISKTTSTITLEDENNNQFFIDRSTMNVSMRDSGGDNTTLITDDSEFQDFIVECVERFVDTTSQKCMDKQ